jgi:hypothetical protein
MPDLRNNIVIGVCCAYCRHYERPACPVKTADPWSKFKDFCGEYVPSEHNNAALTLREGFSTTEAKENAAND